MSGDTAATFNESTPALDLSEEEWAQIVNNITTDVSGPRTNDQQFN